MINKYPEIEVLIEQGINRGKAEYIENITITKRSRGATAVATTLIYILSTETEKNGVIYTEELYQRIKQIKRLISREGTSKLIIATQEGIDGKYVRKLTEYELRKNNAAITYLTIINQGMGQASAGESMTPPNKRRDATVLIRTGKTSYADLLRIVKSGVDVLILLVGIKQLKRTAAGDLLVVQGGTDEAKALRREVESKVKDVKVAEKRTSRTCVIIRIDIITEEDEIIREIEAIIKLEKDKIHIKTILPGRFGSQTASMDLSKRQAEDLVKKRENKIRVDTVPGSEQCERYGTRVL